MTPRVAHVISTPSGMGGAEKVLHALVMGGSERGWDQLILNPFAEDPSSSRLAHACAPVPYEGMSSGLLGLPRLRLWLGRALQDFHPDLVHVHLFHALVVLATLPVARRAKTVLTHHHGALLLCQGRKLEALLDRWAGQTIDEVVAVSESVRRFLVEGYGYPPSGLAFIPNGWSGQPRARSITPSSLTVVSVANLREEKGHDLLLTAFQTVRRDVPARLVLVGGGPLEADLRGRIRQLGLDDAVEMTGPVDDVWPYLAASDLFVQASIYESSGLAVMEAMAAGLAVLASDVGATSELVRPHITGELFPVGDASELAQRMKDLLRSPLRRAELGRAAQEAARPLSIESMVVRYLDLYENVLAGTGGRG